MISLLRSLWRLWFCYRIPVAGERWRLDEENPFKTTEVTVLEVRDKWVHYTFGIMQSYLPVRTFVSIYLPCDEMAE